MAEVVNDFPATRWDDWLDGKTWKLRAGIDFQVSAQSFRVLIYKAAARRGKRARVAVREDGRVLYVQAFG